MIMQFTLLQDLSMDESWCLASVCVCMHTFCNVWILQEAAQLMPKAKVTKEQARNFSPEEWNTSNKDHKVPARAQFSSVQYSTVKSV
jgi:hypothetical protein